MPLKCNDPNGFGLKPDGATLELRGEVCSTLQREAKATLKAECACSDIVLNKRARSARPFSSRMSASR